MQIYLYTPIHFDCLIHRSMAANRGGSSPFIKKENYGVLDDTSPGLSPSYITLSPGLSPSALFDLDPPLMLPNDEVSELFLLLIFDTNIFIWLILMYICMCVCRHNCLQRLEHFILRQIMRKWRFALRKTI